ncbi:hypothetical protein RN001_003162 [Aquatica leii]|uniref:Ion transport domain-containing protein n=1 Tax=Aquatica leii TaxID=1421715 RepID=A0AAN7SDR9_9COLE|nr:hypothetical protein RN001_003162 [Aquatica leii]
MGSYELQRTDSICPPPEVQLLEYVKSNNTPKIKSFVTENPDSVNAIVGHPYDKPVLYIACYELANETRPDTIKTLINLGANLYWTEDVHNYMEALHFATLGGNPNILKVIIDKIIYGKINSQTSNNNTALNLLIKEGNFLLGNYVECLRMLLQADIDVNIADSKNLTPIFWAAKKGYSEVVQIILLESNQQVDIDNHKLRGKSARDYMIENNIDFSFSTRNNNKVENSTNDLFDLLKQNNEDAFVACQNIPNFVADDDGVQTLLQLATKNCLYGAVDCLLKNGADPNQTTQKTPNYPIVMAATRGYYKIFKLLLECENIIIPSGVLIELLKHSDSEKITDHINFDICYDLLVKNKEKKFDVNDGDGNKTALHYAARYGGTDKILDLLRLGASMACKNKYGALPIEDIDANTLETHLNECMITNVDTNIDKENFTATFNYKTLMPPNSQNKFDKAPKTPDVESARKLIASEVEQLSRETQVISYISKSPELKHLLKHPTITSFLYMKWHRIRWFFYTNLAFYITFCFFLIFYILLVYGNHNNNNNEALTKALSTLLCITFILLLLREIFQIVVSAKTYFRNLENYVELLIIILTAYILFKDKPLEDVRKQISAFAILLAACGMVLLIGQHPKMSTNIVMLRTVSANFFKFLLWYSILIIAFSLSFYILLKDDGSEDLKNDENDLKNDDDEINFFTNPALSLFKTIVMLTGEFDAGSIKFDTYPLTTHFIFMLFVIMIAIILFNLLNGLAVSDTQMIKSNAELVGHIARIEHIAYIESMLLGHILPTSCVNWFQEYFCCLSLRVRRRFAVPGILIKRVCLFPYILKDYKLIVYPNQYAKVVFPDQEHIDSNSCIKQCTSIYLDKQTAKRIKQLIRERREFLIAERLEVQSIAQQTELIKKQQEDIMELKQTLHLILSKLDYMVSQHRN